MALFTVFTYKRRQPALGAVMDALTAASHVQAEREVRATLTGRRRPIHAHALATTTGLYQPDDQVAVGRDLTFLHGFVVPAGGPGVLTASAAASQLVDGVDSAIFDSWGGDHSLCHVSAGGEVTAWSDLHRVQSVFWIDTPWLFAVSTRPSMLRLLAGDPGWDTEALAGIAATGYALGDATVHEGVRAVPQGTAIRYDGKSVSFVERDRVVTNPSERGLDLSDPWTQRQLDLGIEHAGRAVALAGARGEPIELALTGGKDSRLVLAICLAHGLGPRLQLYTRGTADHPDVVVARLLAERTGLPHRVIEPGPAKPPTANFLQRIARHGFQTDGLVGAWDHFTGERTSSTITVSGLMGEILKAYAHRPFDYEKAPDPLSIVSLQSPFDPMGVLTTDASAQLADGLDRRFTTLLERGYTHEDLPDLFYYENRIPNWLGYSKQVHTFTSTSIAPLGSVPLTRVAFRATAAERRAELIHFLIMQRTAPQLLDLPFAMQTWHPSLPGAPAVEAIPLPTRSGPPVRAHGTWQFDLWRPGVRQSVNSMISSLEHPAIWEAIDRGSLLAQMEGPPLGIRKIMSLLGLLPLAMFLDGKAGNPRVANPLAHEPIPPYRFEPVDIGPRRPWSRRHR